jgi:hypothetical protein
MKGVRNSFLFVTIIGVIACNGNKETQEKDTVVGQKTAAVTQYPAIDSTEIRKVITDFYNWYNKNYTKFQEYNLYSSIKKKDMPPYKINWDEVEKYHDFIRTSAPQLGEEFIKNQKHFLQQCDSAFKVDVEDDIPYGFDYDWYTNSQEDAQYLVDEINKIRHWPISWSGDYAIVDVKGGYDNNGKQEIATFVTIAMKKENGQWKIAKIGID